MKQFISATLVLMVLVPVKIPEVDGSLWEKYLPSGISNIWKLADMVTFKSDSPISDVILHFIDKFREGLKESGGEHIPIPDFDWHIVSENLNGVINTYDLHFSGVPNFEMKNLTTNVLNRTVDVDIEFPALELYGQFYASGQCMGIPIWGGGNISVKLVQLYARGGAQLEASSAIGVNKPRLGVNQVVITATSLYSGFLWYHVLLLLLTIVGLIALIAVLCTLKYVGYQKTIPMRKGSYRAVI